MFAKAWKILASDSGFFEAQHSFIEATHYDPFSERLKQQIGLDLAARSATLRDVAWSVAVQHGSANNVFKNALKGSNVAALTDQVIIDAVFKERDEARSILSFVNTTGSSGTC